MAVDRHEWRTGRHVVYDLHAHIILTPKFRRKVMTERVSNLLKDVLEEACNRRGVTLDAFETDEDHAHLLVSYPPKISLSSLVMSLKTVSSKAVREQQWPEITQALWGKHFWSPSYAVTSCGGAPLEIVKTYIENQKTPQKLGNPNFTPHPTRP